MEKVGHHNNYIEHAYIKINAVVGGKIMQPLVLINISIEAGKRG